ncbi:MAG: hypothetical protein JKY34_15545, partial [Kordiimonadaceae bacterium]|nr:hypothetical protein [Kordiimonadaceae bacterium]
MIVCRAPYRVSFFGGGTDYSEWFKAHGGCFLSTAIDHHIYITLRQKPALDKFRYRVVWRELEDVSEISAIKHPFVRAALAHDTLPSGLDVVYSGDLPHGAGLGSSSTFGVTFLTALDALKGAQSTPDEMAKRVYHIERHTLGETVGVQDQYAAAFGGFNYGRIGKDGSLSLERIRLPESRLKALEDRLIFVFTGVSRHASDVAASKVKNFKSKEQSLHRMMAMTEEARAILLGDQPLDAFGELLHESWMLKKDLSDKICPPVVENIYADARKAGVLGGKLLGAGGGGFMMLFVPEGEKGRVEQQLRDYVQVPVKLDAPGPEV